MYLARLDNEVFFKKAFTDKFVLKAFVKDIIGIDIEPETIETEKSFMPKLGNINFNSNGCRYNIFAEDSAKRVIVEIQKVEYDRSGGRHNFDRFLHYHLQAITEQQRSSERYTVDRTVYTIVVMTAPYKVNEKTKEIYKDEVLISSLNPKNLNGIERKIFNHELVYLNPNYKGEDTPQNYRDWLDLLYESIHNPENPKVNFQNKGVMRAIDIISYENISPEEWEQSKIEAGKQVVIKLERDEAVEERNVEIIQASIQNGLDNCLISKLTGLSEEYIEGFRR